MAASLSLRPVWLYPAVAGLLLVASLAVYIPSRTEPSRALRVLSLGLVGVLVIANMVSLVYLVHGVFVGSKLSPTGLLLAGAALWVVNVAVFALIYWELDGGGPEARADGDRDYPDLVFPQQQQDQQGLTPPDWKPMFADYLYVSLTAATAFSPTPAGAAASSRCGSFRRSATARHEGPETACARIFVRRPAPKRSASRRG